MKPAERFLTDDQTIDITVHYAGERYADTYTVEIVGADGIVDQWAMSADADQANGVCMYLGSSNAFGGDLGRQLQVNELPHGALVALVNILTTHYSGV